MEARDAPRGRRLVLFLLILGLFGMMAVLSQAAVHSEAIFLQLEMKALPAPTEGFLALAGALRTPLGRAVWLLAGLGLAALAFRGAFDRHLNGFIALTVLLLLLLPGFYYLALQLPIWRIERSLR